MRSPHTSVSGLREDAVVGGRSIPSSCMANCKSATSDVGLSASNAGCRVAQAARFAPPCALSAGAASCRPPSWNASTSPCAVRRRTDPPHLGHGADHHRPAATGRVVACLLSLHQAPLQPPAARSGAHPGDGGRTHRSSLDRSRVPRVSLRPSRIRATTWAPEWRYAHPRALVSAPAAGRCAPERLQAPHHQSPGCTGIITFVCREYLRFSPSTSAPPWSRSRVRRDPPARCISGTAGVESRSASSREMIGRVHLNAWPVWLPRGHPAQQALRRSLRRCTPQDKAVRLEAG